jgi:hypothetical protein
MRRTSVVLLVAFLVLTACNSIYAPVKVVTGGDIFDQAATRGVKTADESYWSTLPPTQEQAAPSSAYEAGRQPIWEIGKPFDSGILAFDYMRYISREIILLLLTIVADLTWRVTAAHNSTWLLPAFVYIIAAIGRLVFVPCTWVVRLPVRLRPELTNSATLPIWNIGSETIRYGLVFYEEFALLVCILAVYAMMFAGWPHLRPRGFVR